MSEAQLAITIDGGASFARLQRAFAFAPKAADRAMARALRKLKTFMNRAVLRPASAATGIPQKLLMPRAKRPGRWFVSAKKDGISVWFGTNPLPINRMGTSDRARKAQRKANLGYTDVTIKTRKGAQIKMRAVEIDPAVSGNLGHVAEGAAEFFEKQLKQQLNFALNVEAK